MENNARDQDLRRALSGDDLGAPSADDVRLIQRAVDGELPRDEYLSLVDRLHADPVLASAWRTAVTLRDELLGEGIQITRRVWFKHWSITLGLAATLAIVVLTPSILNHRSEPVSTVREAPQTVIQSKVQDGIRLPRDAFELEWDAGGKIGTFGVHVLDSNLEVLYAQTAVKDPRLRIPEEALAGLDPDSIVLWWVETTTKTGLRIRSPTFVQRVR